MSRILRNKYAFRIHEPVGGRLVNKKYNPLGLILFISSKKIWASWLKIKLFHGDRIYINIFGSLDRVLKFHRTSIIQYNIIRRDVYRIVHYSVNAEQSDSGPSVVRGKSSGLNRRITIYFIRTYILASPRHIRVTRGCEGDLWQAKIRKQ